MKKVLTCILEIVIAIVIVAISIVNICKNNNFWTASITQVCTLAVSLGIVFWANQYKNDVRKSKEHAESLLKRLQLMVEDDSFSTILNDENAEETRKNLNLTLRRMSNCIDVLKKYSTTLNFKEEIKYITEQFEKYKTTIGDHINDLDYLSKTELEFRRIAENIDAKCDYIIFSLYT